MKGKRMMTSDSIREILTKYHWVGVTVIIIIILVASLIEEKTSDGFDSMILEDKFKGSISEEFKFVYTKATIVQKRRSMGSRSKGHWLTVYKNTKTGATLIVIQDDEGIHAIYK